MRSLKRDIRKVDIILVSLLFLFVLLVWVPESAVGAHDRVSELVTPVTGTVQATPTEDATMTALNKEQSTLQVKQLQLQNDRSIAAWLWNSSGVLGTTLAALLAVTGVLVTAVINFGQWKKTQTDAQDKDRIARQDAQDKDRIARQDAQDKDLKDKAEERFKTASTALGTEKESIQVVGAILLRSFLNKDDKKSYERYYPQIFDLAAAFLRLPRTSKQPEDPDGLSHSPEDPDTPLPPTALSQALIMVFKEVFPLTRSQNQGSPQSLDATGVQLDNAYLERADLKQVWMPNAFLQHADLIGADLSEANLRETNFNGAYLSQIHLNKSDLSWATFVEAKLAGADLGGADLGGADLSNASLFKATFDDEANLGNANLTGANLEGAILTKANLEGANLEGAILTKANLEGAILTKANLEGAILTKANLEGANLEGAILIKANLNGVKLYNAILFRANLEGAGLSGAKLNGVKLNGANLEGAVLEGAVLKGADLSGAKLSRVHLERAILTQANLHKVHGLTKEQLEACESKGAIIDEGSTTSASQSIVAPSPPSKSNDGQVSSTQSVQENTSTGETGGSNAVSSQKDRES